MQGAMRLSQWNPNFTINPSLNFDNLVEEKNGVSENTRKMIINKNNSMNITINKAVDYYSIAADIKTFKYSYPVELNIHIKRLVIDMNCELKIEKIIKRYKIIHLILFIISLFVTAASWIPDLINGDIAFVVRPMSIAFSLMIITNYYARRLN